MKCVVCKGVGILDKEQTEICPNCEGAGEIITEEMVNGNDCRTGSCT
jgi:DnaJ-class molecular chaperone